MSTPQEELAALRRMAELEDRAAGKPQPTESVSVAQPPQQSAQTAWDKASAGDIVAGLPATRMLTGAAAPVVGALQAGANVGDWLAQKLGQDPVLGDWLATKVGEYEASKQRGMAALGNEGSDIAGFAGSVASGGAAVKGIKPATSWAGKVAQGTGIGAVAGAVTPSTTPGIEQTVTQAALGATLGGAVPVAAPVVKATGKMLHRVAEPMLNPKAIKGRAYLEAAGPKAQEIIRELKTNKPIVPGSMPTAGEAASGVGRAEFSAMQKSAEKVLPSNYLARSDARQLARVNQLNKVAGTDADLATAKTLRSTTGKQNYAVAETEGIDQGMADAMQQEIGSLMGRPSMQEAKALAIKLAREKDIELSDFGSMQGLDWVKKGLDEQISAASKAGSSAGKEKLAALLQTKQDLLATLDTLSPAYTKARETYAAQSTPINQMEVGRYLKDKLTSAVDETATQKTASYAGALRDAPGTIKRALDGGPRYEKLSDVLTPDQVAKVESIRDDLAKTARQELMARKGAQAGPSAVDVASQSISSATGGGKIPNPLSRVVTIANAIIGRLEGKIDKKLAIEIAAEMLEPKVVAKAMEEAVARGAKKSGTTAALNKLRNPATAVGVNALIKSTQGQNE